MTALAIAYLGLDEARSLTDRIKAHVSELLPLIKEAFERRADVALGYANWLDYCDTELRGLRLPVERRREAVAELREAGMSTRAIGGALGVTHTQIKRDLASLEREVPVPERVTGLDRGRQQPAARPAPATPLVSEPERPKPPAWDPEERRQHEEEVRRVQIIEHARAEAKTIVTAVRAAVVTVVSGSRLGERGLVTREMIAELRAAIDLLEKEIDGAE